MNTDNDYWFLLKPYVHISFEKEEKILIYNTRSGNYLESKERDFITLINSAREKKNLGVSLISKQKLSKRELTHVIREAVKMQMVELFSICDYPIKPISLQPILNIQRSVEKLKKGEDRFIGEDILHYLTSLNLYINSECEQNCSYCESYYRQCYCCTKANQVVELSLSVITSIIKQTTHSSLGRINVLGGNILMHKNSAELINILTANNKFKTYFWIHYRNFASSEEALLKGMLYKNVIVNFPISEKALAITFSRIDEYMKFYFIVESEAQLLTVESIINQNKNLNIEIKPFYNRMNLPFFTEHVFIDKTDIFSNTVSQREIFRNQTLNVNYFGNVSVFPDGTVKVTPNTEILGNIYQNSMLELLAEELGKNTAWRKIRNSKPCEECLYQYICPPLSNYEEIIGRTNLCSIKQ